MPLCIICQSNFYYQTQDCQRESCDCGQEISALEAQDMTPEDVLAKSAQWNAAIEDAMKPLDDEADRECPECGGRWSAPFHLDDKDCRACQAARGDR